ncbi:MAG TPA: hypothetical protein VGV85_05725 [Longimicrobiaceae bacterium]|nr:hypothetical protein [Longimicrobiaceae bacterium]
MSSTVTRLYFGSPVWVQNAVVSAYGLRLRFLRYGRGQRRLLGELLESQWLPAERLRALQLERLNQVVDHARRTVPLYRDRLPESPVGSLDELPELPLVHKADLRAPRDTVVSSRYADARLDEIHTGGTTGSPLTVYCDRATLQRNYAFFGRLRAWAGVREGGRTATFAGRPVVPPAQKEPPFWRMNVAGNAMLFSSYHIGPATVRHYVDRLVSFRPELIDSYPSSIEPLARYVLEKGITSIRPRAVITSSETLEPGVRRLVMEAFGCPVLDHYGAAEMAALVTQCAGGSYHVNPEFGIVELVRDGRPAGPGEAGEIVATGFINPVMPLIRYATGDMAAWREGECACGRAFPMLAGVEGRRDDVIVTPEGRRIGRLDPIFKAVSSIYEAQIVQDAPDHVRVNVVGGEMTPEDEASLLHELRVRVGPSMRLDIARVDSIARTSRGKFRAVVNLVGSSRAAPSGPV